MKLRILRLQVRFSFDEPDFAMIDTLFSLAEAHLFMQLVELKDQRPHLAPAGKSYPDLYRRARGRCLRIAAHWVPRPCKQSFNVLRTSW